MLFLVTDGYRRVVSSIWDPNGELNRPVSTSYIRKIYDTPAEHNRGNNCLQLTVDSVATPSLLINGEQATRWVSHTTVSGKDETVRRMKGYGNTLLSDFYQPVSWSNVSSDYIEEITVDQNHVERHIWVYYRSYNRTETTYSTIDWLYNGSGKVRFIVESYSGQGQGRIDYEHKDDIPLSRTEHREGDWIYPPAGWEVLEIADVSYANPDPMPSKLQHILEAIQEDFGAKLFTVNYSDLCSRAVSNTRVNHANMLTLPKELLSTITGQEAIKLADDLIGRIESTEGTRELIAHLYLQSRFGSRLTGIELGQFMENELGTKWRQRLQAKTYGSLSSDQELFGLTFELYNWLTFDYAFTGLNYLVKRWDNASLPTLSDIWDAVPYSFVVDWAAGIGDMIAAYEHNRYLTAMDISNIWQSYVATSTYSSHRDDQIINASIRIYSRRERAFVSGSSYELGPAGSTKNIADLTAMIISGPA